MIFNLTAQTRVTQRKSDLTNLRAEGLIPAVVYGAGMDTVSISLKKNEFGQCYKKSFTELAFYEIELDGKKYHTLLKEKQVHPVTREFLHLDFMVLPKKSAIELEIPINYVGEPVGLKEGGVMDIVIRTAKISVMADSIPQDIEIDISHLKVGDNLHVSDLPAGNWEYKDNPDNAIIVIHAKKTATEETVAEEAAAPEAAEEPEA